MTAQKIVLMAVGLCPFGLAGAEVDLSRPFEVDNQTIHLFHLDDAANGQVHDAAPGGKTGTVLPGVLPTLGRFGGGVSFDGVKGWVDVADLPQAQNLTALTVECWVKFHDKATGDIICRNSLYLMRLGGTVTAEIGVDGGWKVVSGAMPVPVGRWTHLAMTYDQQTKEIRIYVDGRLDVAQVPKGVTAGKLNGGSNLLRLGTNDWTPSGSMMYGKMAELRVSSVARQYQPLSTAEEPPVPENTNLLLNPGFESGMYGWRVNDERNALLLWHVETGKTPQGRSFLKAIDRGARMVMSYPITIARGKTHTLSALMRANTPCRGRLGLHCAAEAQAGSKTDTVNVTQEWKRFSMKYDIPKNWPSNQAYVEVGAADDSAIEIDAVSLVVGNGAEYTQTEAQSVGLAAALPTQSTYMLKTGSKLPVDVSNSGERERKLTLECAFTGWQGQLVKSERLDLGTLPVGQSVSKTFAVPDERVGWFLANFTVREGEKTISQTSRIFNVIEPMKGVGDVADSPLGMNTHMEREPNAHLDCNLGMLSLCGVKWIRAWWGWGMAEKVQGQFNWTEYSRQFDAVQRAGMDIFPILLRYYPQFEQAWAGKVDKIERPPSNLELWGKFVEATANQFRGRVKAWEVWNEPNYSSEFSSKDYAALLKVTYERIKAADPKMEVVGGGGVRPDYIRQFCEAGAAKDMDIVSNHSYSQLGRPFERMWDLAEEYKPIVAQFHCTPRVWHTEQGSGADGIGYRAIGQSELDCAVNVVQSYLSAFAAGVEKFFWFSSQTTPTYGWAVYYENYVPRPRLVAVNGLARLLKDRHVTGRLTLGEGKVACVPLDGKAGAAAALWNLDDTVTVRLPAGADVVFTDMLCNPIENLPKAGEIELRMGQPVYVLARQPGVKQLTDMLAGAQIEIRLPVEVSASLAADGQLEVALRNESGSNQDLRVSVQEPSLFAAAPAPQAVLDLAPQATHKLSFPVAKRPAAGTEVSVTVKIEAGTQGIRQSVREVKVRF